MSSGWSAPERSFVKSHLLLTKTRPNTFGSELDKKETQLKRHIQEVVRATKSYWEGLDLEAEGTMRKKRLFLISRACKKVFLQFLFFTLLLKDETQ